MKPRTVSIKANLDSAKAAIEAAKDEMQNKTAVEWLVEYIHSDKYQAAFGQTYISPVVVDKAKELEKSQIVQAFNEVALDGLELGEQYYNFVFKS